MNRIRYIVVLLSIVLLGHAAMAGGLHSRIHFTTQPPLTATVGIEYTYDADAGSTDSTETITYALLRAPAGMSIDTLTGLVTWTPSIAGFASVDILARGSKGNFGDQSFGIRVSGPQGKITGQIVDSQTRVPLAGVLVQLFPARPHIMASWSGIPITILSGVTDTAGMYSIAAIDTGTYYAEAVKAWHIMMMSVYQSVEYLPVWWRNSPTMSGADPIRVLPDSTLTIDFQMQKKVPPVIISVSGIVTDTAGMPIKNALVVVSKLRQDVTTDDDDGDMPVRLSSMEEPQWGDIEDASGTGRTDSTGAYSVRVVAGRTYIASAYARGYVIQFYNNKANVLEADRFIPQSDTTGFNFTLAAFPKATSIISGSVRDSVGNGVASRMILFPASRMKPHGARTVGTDSLGNFQIQNLYDGKYLLMAVPYKDYLPAFYKLDSFGVWNWKNADTITLSGSANGLVVGVIQRRSTGAGIIHGRIRTSDGSPVAGAVVYASLKSDGFPVGYAVTDANGSYDLEGLPPDEYTLVADKPEYMTMTTASVSIDYSVGGAVTASDVTFDALSGIEPGGGTSSATPATIALYQNYPNPFNPSTRIQYDVPRDAHVTVMVFNIIGQQVAVLADRFQHAGSYNVEFDGSVLPSGVYFYRLQIENNVLTKKMILMR